MPTVQSLMSIATNSKLRIHERINIIKGEDKRISSPEEAKAILSIPSSDVIWSDNKDTLPLAQMEARYYLKNGDKNLWDDLAAAYKYCKEKGSVALARMFEYFSSQNGSLAQNEK